MSTGHFFILLFFADYCIHKVKKYNFEQKLTNEKYLKLFFVA